jgi:hypothetical protein
VTTTTVRLTPSEARLPGYLAAVGKDLYARGWRLPTAPPKAYLSATRELACVDRRHAKQGRYYLLLGHAGTRTPRTAIPPQAKACPERLVIRCATHPGEHACQRITLACARGLPVRPAEVPGPYPWRVCLALGLATRCALEAAMRGAPGTTLTEWLRHCLRT